MSRSRIFLTLLGGGLISAMLLSEIVSSNPNGIGPYQAVIMLLGGLFLLLGFISTGHWLSKVITILISTVFSLILIEGMLYILQSMNINVTYPDTQELVDDPILGKRTPPGAIGHDERGWRNQIALDQADIVTIGDSQTWGVNVSLIETYPSVLAELMQMSVYNMSQGSYGAVQYHRLVEYALDLSPKLITIGLYFGNDFVDAYTLIYEEDYYPDLRLPRFDMTAITQTIAEQARQFQSANLTQAPRKSIAEQSFLERLQSGTYIGKFLTQLGILQSIDNGVISWQIEANRQVVEESPLIYSEYSHNGVVTFLTPAYRQLVVDSDSPIVSEGTRITKLEYVEIKTLLESTDIELLVILIPTKEFVYLPFLEEDSIPPIYQRLGQQEFALRQEVMKHFDDNGIQYLDILPLFRQAVQEDIAIYPPSFDGHPSANGYWIIANGIAEYLKENMSLR